MLALLCVAVLGVWADGVGTFGGGDGSAKNPYIINTTAHWDQLATDVNGGNAFRAYFHLDGGLTCGEPNSPNAVRAFNLCFGNGEEDTGIKEVKSGLTHGTT